MTKLHTKGPWMLSGSTIREDFGPLGPGRIIATAVGDYGSGPYFVEDPDEKRANARLIAAAPKLLEALQALVDAAWLEDSHAVQFDGTVMFGPGYDFSGIDGVRRAEFREEGIEFVVWPAGGAGGNWSAYSTYEGSLWFELFETEDEAREQCMKLLDQVMPDHPISKARAALAATGEPQ